MRLYHRSYYAEVIATEGFRDGEGGYLTAGTHRGVWMSDQPLNVNEGAQGDVILAVEMPEDIAAPFEWTEEGKGYREFLIPAETLNRYPIVESVPDWMPSDDRVRRSLGLPERRPGWQFGDPLWPD